MAGLNKVQIIGHLGNDPEITYTQGGKAIAKISVATTERWKNSDGEQQEKTSWHRCVAFGKLAEIIGEYLVKGKQVYLEGKLSYGSYEKDGVKHYTTDIMLDQMQMLGARESGGGERTQRQAPQQSSGGQRPARPARPARQAAPQQPMQDDFSDDDIPF